MKKRKSSGPGFLSHSWTPFQNKDPTAVLKKVPQQPGYGYRMDVIPRRPAADRSIIMTVYNRIATDVAAVTFQHVRTDEQGRYKETINSNLNYCLNTEANLDQTGRELRYSIALTALESGCAAVIPTLTDIDPNLNSVFDIQEIRVGTVVEWKPSAVLVNIYNPHTGNREDRWFLKKNILLVYNPFYAVMNEPNSTMQRLIRLLALLDDTDKQKTSKKFNMIIQLPYVVRTDARKTQAKERLADLEDQLENSPYGIAYLDGTEKITQLNRPLDTTLSERADNLTSMLFSQLGVTQAIFDGTADQMAIENYMRGIIEPMVSAIVDEMKRKWLTKTALTRGITIMAFRDILRAASIMDIANIADVCSRNEILTPNEMRGILGFKPSADPESDQLRNRNMPNDDMGIEEDSEDYTVEDTEDYSDEEVPETE